MAQRACAVDHSSGACAIEGAQAVIAQISAQMELSYTSGRVGGFWVVRLVPVKLHYSLFNTASKFDSLNLTGRTGLLQLVFIAS